MSVPTAACVAGLDQILQRWSRAGLKANSTLIKSDSFAIFAELLQVDRRVKTPPINRHVGHYEQSELKQESIAE